MAEPSENRTLYGRGRRYAARADSGRTLKGIADKADGEGLKEARVAFDFAGHVATITAVVPAARGLILGGSNPHLTPSVVQRIAGRAAARTRLAMARADEGLHSFAPEPPAGLPAEHRPRHFDLTRLHEAAHLLQRVRRVVERPGRALRVEECGDLFAHVTAVRVAIDALRLVLGEGTSVAGTPPVDSRDDDRADVVKLVRKARGPVEAVTGDLLRAAHTRAPGPGRPREGCRRGCRALPFGPIDPIDRPGTYVVVLQTERADVVRMARLGSFWFPAGHLLHVGSAFGGGVAGRTARHIAGTEPQLWGLDSLRGFARPIELW